MWEMPHTNKKPGKNGGSRSTVWCNTQTDSINTTGYGVRYYPRSCHNLTWARQWVAYGICSSLKSLARLGDIKESSRPCSSLLNQINTVP